MAKRRAIWPDLLTDRRRRKTSMEAMCLYYDLLMCVDDQGIYPFDVDKIILEVIPYFRGEDEEVEKFLLELIKNEFIETYYPEGHDDQFLIVLDWYQQGSMSNEYNKYPNKKGIVEEGRKRLGGKQRVSVIRTLAAENDNTCQCCNERITAKDDQKISDVFTIIERVNVKSRGSKYAENYTLICKNCAKNQNKYGGDAKVTQCVTTGDTEVTSTGIRDKGLGLRDKGLGLRDKSLKQEVGASASSAEFKFLDSAKVAKKYHQDIIEFILFWSKAMKISVDLTKDTQINRKRAADVALRLKEGYPLSELKNLVEVASSDDFTMGKNDRKTPYNSINHLLREKSFEIHLNRSKREEGSTRQEFMREVFGDLQNQEIDITPAKVKKRILF